MLALSPLNMYTVTRLRASNNLDDKKRVFSLLFIGRGQGQGFLCRVVTQLKKRRNEITLEYCMRFCQSTYKEQLWVT